MINIAELLKLPAEDRLAIAEAVWDSLAAEPSAVPVRPDHVREITKRIDEYGKGIETVSDWNDVKSEARARLRG